MPEISIKAETLFHIGSFAVNNSMVLSSLVFIFFIVFGALYFKESKKSENKSGLYYTLNLMLRPLYNLFHSIVHDKIDVFFPLLSALFLWILIQNWSGLLPGVGSIMVAVREPIKHEIVATQTKNVSHAPKKAEAVGETKKEETEIKHIPLFRGNNADLNATLALAIVTMVMVQVYGIQFLGLGAYLGKFINLSNPINFFLGILEIMSEFSKVLSFAFRLFGNIFAGEVLLTIVAFLVPVLASFPFLILEVFVGFVQALVFSMLTSVFFSMAVSKH